MNTEGPEESRGLQSYVFLTSEADNWYLRNKVQLEKIEQSIPTNLIIQVCTPYAEKINSILEIGCASAQKLELVTRHFDAHGFGIDPSRLAINDARNRFTANGLKSSFSVGVASKLPYKDKSMDLVLLGFFLYVVGRNELESTIKEVDRVLKPGGFLLIEDFDYGSSISKDYVHHHGVKTYKENYAQFFIDEFRYYLIEKHSYSHTSNSFHLDPDERVSTQILYKPLT